MKIKKAKLTPEQKAEARAEKKAWNEMIRRMRKKGALVED